MRVYVFFSVALILLLSVCFLLKLLGYSTYTAMISSCSSLLAKQAATAAPFVGGRASTIVRQHSSSSKKAIANSRLQTFRNVISSRVSARRFEPNISIPDNVWLDILRMTMVSSRATIYNVILHI